MDYRGIDGRRRAEKRKATSTSLFPDEPTLRDVCSYDNDEIYLVLSVTEIEDFHGCSFEDPRRSSTAHHVVRKLLVDCQTRTKMKRWERERERKRERARRSRVMIFCTCRQIINVTLATTWMIPLWFCIPSNIKNKHTHERENISALDNYRWSICHNISRAGS